MNQMLSTTILLLAIRAVLMIAVICKVGTQPVMAAQDTLTVVQERMTAYRKTGNIQKLVDAYTPLSILVNEYTYSPSTAGKTNKNETALLAALDVLQECYKSRDPDYDLNVPHPFSVNTPVPEKVRQQQSWANGMDPAAVKDPEARKEYEKAIVDNKRDEQKNMRELLLQKVMDMGVKDFSDLLQRERGNSEVREHLTNIVASAVTNSGLREKLLGKSATR